MGRGAFPTKSKAVILTSYTILFEVGKVYVDSKLYVVRPVRSRVKINGARVISEGSILTVTDASS